MSLYPTLEDMKVDHIIQSQEMTIQNVQNSNKFAPLPATHAYQIDSADALYPRLVEYMGLNIAPEMFEQNQLAVPSNNNQLSLRTASGQMQVAPITGNHTGLLKSEIKQGIRYVVLCKNQSGKLGLKVQSVNKGVFISFIEKDSPATLAGLRFGDQILQINEETVAGWDKDKVSTFFKKASPERISLAVRDRPFERTITLHKDSAGTLGFVFKDSKITSVMKDSSAARNGVLINHHIVEINGQNVVGLKEKEIKEIVDGSGRTITITIIPSFVFEHIMKNIGWSLVKKKMDHSIPEI